MRIQKARYAENLQQNLCDVVEQFVRELVAGNFVNHLLNHLQVSRHTICNIKYVNFSMI
jgi:hypothetical protein